MSMTYEGIQMLITLIVSQVSWFVTFMDSVVIIQTPHYLTLLDLELACAITAELVNFIDELR